MNRIYISSSIFSTRIVDFCLFYKIRTLNSLEKFLAKFNINDKLTYGFNRTTNSINTIRVNLLLKEIERFKSQ